MTEKNVDPAPATDEKAKQGPPGPKGGEPVLAGEPLANGEPSAAAEPAAETTKPPGKKKKRKKKKAAEGEAEAKKNEEDAGEILVRRGNPLRYVRGGVTAGLAALFAFLLMAHQGQLSFGVPLGGVFVAVAAWGLMDLLGTFDDTATAAASTTLGKLAAPLGQTGATLLLFAFSLAGAAAGRWSQGIWGVIVTLAFLALVASVFDLGVKLGPWKTDELGLARPLWRREGFWVIAASAVLLLPFLGAYSLWDPWETHYGEVAREMLARDDWISLWWAQDGWFWSKPILDFWMQAIFMASLGVHYRPDEMLQGVGGATAHPEWVVRAPVFLLTVLALYILYKGAAKVFGRRAALLGALVLATMPDWYFLAHQTMTDMPFVAPMTAAMGLLMLGLYTDAEVPVRLHEVKAGRFRFRLSGWHLVFGAILLCAIPQILYLLSRNLELVLHGEHGIRPHWDAFRSGSGGGNCGLPGNENCVSSVPASIPPSVRGNFEGIVPSVWRFVGAFEPALQAVVWSAVIGTVLYMNWGERRARRLYYLAAWFFAALATMAKGPAGFGLPMICAFAYVCTTKRWKELLRFELLSGLLIILGVAIPWYVAMYVRHGSPFTDRLIFHDMFNRAFHHVHDTNEGDDTSFRFYIWQLGYALFPWTGLAPLGLLYWLRRSDAADRGKGDASVMLLMWFLFAFALFSFMGTKFHHYIFPAVPPIAMLLGVVLDDMLGEGPVVPSRGLPIYLAWLTGGVALLVAGAARMWPGSLFGTHTAGDVIPPSFGLGGVLVAGGAGAIGLCMAMYRKADTSAKATGAPADGSVVTTGSASTPYRDEDPAEKAARARAKAEQERRKSHEQLMISGAAVAGALMITVVGRDLSIKPDNADQPGAIRLLHLFTYNYRRPWPDSLDFSAILTAFTVVALVLGIALSVRATRKHLVVAFMAFAMVWAVWGLDVYMVKTAPHWGQHEVIEAYYRDCKGPEEPIVAYQMNWKGENFYTGNRIPAFVSSGANFTNWMKTQREKGVRVMYFVTEHGRIGGLKSEVSGKSYREITDKVLCNKFVLVRAEL